MDIKEIREIMDCIQLAEEKTVNFLTRTVKIIFAKTLLHKVGYLQSV